MIVMRIVKYVTVLIVILVSVSCTDIKYYSDKSNPLVAQIGDEKLYYKDIDIAYKNMLRDIDSVSVANRYISQWIKDKLKLQESEKLFKNNQSDIELLVEKYRNSQLLYKYENYYGSMVDTTINEREIIEYYNANKYQFKLVSPIVKVRILVLPTKYKNEKELTKKIFSKSTDDYYDLLSISERDNLLFFNFNEDWEYFSKVVRFFPYDAKISYSNYIVKNREAKITDDNKDYIIYISDYRLSGEDMPLSFVYNDVKKAILNQRRGDRYRNIEDSLYNNEKKKNRVYQRDIDELLLRDINNEKKD